MITKLLALSALASAIVCGQNQPVLGEEAVKVSDHVWAIMGWPNIGIVVGSRAVLVVDTGLGPRNGATISRIVTKLSPGSKKLFLATTHFHPEHAAGEAGFPAGTILIRNSVQQREIETSGKEVVDLFAARSEQQKELLANVVFRTPDITFDKETKVDLGDVTVRLLWFGGAHTRGDQLMFVEPDRTLISGDVVQNKVVPNIFRDGGTPSSWLTVLDSIATLDCDVRDYDPTLALDGGADGLSAYRAILAELPRLLSSQGSALFEVGAGQAEAVVSLAADQGLACRGRRRDLAGIERVVVLGRS